MLVISVTNKLLFCELSFDLSNILQTSSPNQAAEIPPKLSRLKKQSCFLFVINLPLLQHIIRVRSHRWFPLSHLMLSRNIDVVACLIRMEQHVFVRRKCFPVLKNYFSNERRSQEPQASPVGFSLCQEKPFGSGIKT